MTGTESDHNLPAREYIPASPLSDSLALPTNGRTHFRLPDSGLNLIGPLADIPLPPHLSASPLKPMSPSQHFPFPQTHSSAAPRTPSYPVQYDSIALGPSEAAGGTSVQLTGQGSELVRGDDGGMYLVRTLLLLF